MGRLDRMILFGERSLHHVLKEYSAHYHFERNHQGIGNVLVFPQPVLEQHGKSTIECRERLGGLGYAPRGSSITEGLHRYLNSHKPSPKVHQRHWHVQAIRGGNRCRPLRIEQKLKNIAPSSANGRDEYFDPTGYREGFGTLQLTLPERDIPKYYRFTPIRIKKPLLK